MDDQKGKCVRTAFQCAIAKMHRNLQSAIMVPRRVTVNRAGDAWRVDPGRSGRAVRTDVAAAVKIEAFRRAAAQLDLA